MSWSFNGVGKPEALKRALDKQLETFGPAPSQSKEEFAHVAPHLKGLLEAAHDDAVVSVEANGHATFAEGSKRTYAYVSVSIRQIGALVE